MAISDTITSMYENVGNVYDVLELAGADLTNVDKNIENLKQSWEERLLYFLANGTDVVWNNWLPKVNGTGESITLNNTIQAKMDFVYKGNTSQSILPSGYTQVDYLHCNAQQYIDTGYTPVQGDNFEFKNVTIKYNVLFSAGNGTYQLILISQDTIPVTNYFKYFSNTSPSYISNITNANIRIENGAFYVNNEQVMTSTYGGDVNTNLFIGIRENGNNPFYGNFGEIIITNGTTTKKHYIPCYRNSDNVIGLYDIVNNQFLTNAGTGNFTYGSVAPNPDYPYPVNVVTGDNEVKVEGKNLIPTQVSAWEQGNISESGNVESTTRIRTIGYYPIKNDTNYHISVQDTNYCFLNIRFYDSSKTYLEDYWTYDFTINGATDKTINIPSSTISNVAYMRVVLRRANSGTITASDITTIEPQIELGTTKTTWEEHKEQTYPINLGSMELCKIGDYQDYIAKSTGKNLFNKATIDEGHYINQYGTLRTDATALLSDYIEITPNTNYYISNRNVWVSIGLYDSSKTFLERISLTTASGILNVTNTSCKYIRVNASLNDKDTLMINEGSTALPYEPYGKAWYKYGAIGKVVLDGSESWNERTNLDNRHQFYAPTDVTNIVGNANVPQQISNYAKYNYASFNYSYVGDFAILDNTKVLYLGVDDSAVLNDFKTQLTNENLIAYYAYATPTITPITDTTLLSQLEAIKKSYNSQTNISQENDNLPFELDVVALGKLD